MAKELFDLQQQADPSCLSRRAFLTSTGLAVATLALETPAATSQPTTRPAFALRGYYLTFMRMPTFALPAWKRAIDCFAADRINCLILWMGEAPEMRADEARQRVRALDVSTELNVLPAFSMQHRGIGNSLEQMRSLLHRAEENVGI